MAHLLHITMDFDSHSVDEWESIILSFVNTVKEKGSGDLLQRCRFVIYFNQLEKDVAVRELIDRVSPVTGSRNIKMALKFD